jgi:hypothetical protein
MTEDAASPERLDPLAALVEFDARRSDLADMWVHHDGMPYGDDEASLITSATLPEWELAEALRGGPDQALDERSSAMARLLRLVGGTGAATLLLLGLREVFFDGKPDDPAAAFAGVLRRLALPVLDGGARSRAGTVLDHLRQVQG